MKIPTKRQLEVLKVLNPYEGRTTYSEAARILGTTEQRIKEIMSRLKKRCPEIYNNYTAIKKILNNGQKKVNNADIIEPNKIKNLNVKEKF